MNTSQASLPLLPLIVDDVPAGLRQALAQEGLPTRPRTPGLGEGRFVLCDSRRGPLTPPGPGQSVLDMAALIDPGEPDPLEALVDTRSKPHQWRHAGRLVCEEIACVDKRAVRQAFLARLRQRIEQEGGVWLRLAACPHPYRTAFNLRLDHDQYQAANFEATLALLAGRADAVTHFVNAAAYADQPRALRRLRGLDVGSHGYWHHTYRTAAENRRNIARGIQSLRDAGLEPAGFAAPHGRFNAGLLAALEELHVDYSSEFGLAYDELPFFPGGRQVLQVPIHPVCPEIFLEAAARTEAGPPGDPARLSPAAAEEALELAADYFRQTAARKHRAGEPLFFYGHPTGRLGGVCRVLAALLTTIDRLEGVWPVTLGRFAAWWRARAAVRMTVRRQGEALVIAADRVPREFPLAVEVCRGRQVASVKLDARGLRLSPAALNFTAPADGDLVAPRRIDRPHNFREQFKRWIDWERVTPVAEIAGGNWQNWAKWALRRWQG